MERDLKNPYRKMALQIGLKEDYGVRAFPTFTSQSKPENDWNMEIDWPDWVSDVHNQNQGERCFIFGTGPSLTTQIDLLPKMVDEYTFTCNRMRQWGDVPFRPYIHCITEPGPIQSWGYGISPLYDYPEAQNRVACMWWPVVAPGWLWLPKANDDIQLRWWGPQGLDDRLSPLPSAWASPLTIAQLALWMGFKKIYLLGVDTTQQGQAWDVEKGRTKKPRNIRSILESADRLHRDMRRAGRELWDCTPGGKLNGDGLIPYADLKEVLNG